MIQSVVVQGEIKGLASPFVLLMDPFLSNFIRLKQQFRAYALINNSMQEIIDQPMSMEKYDKCSNLIENSSSKWLKQTNQHDNHHKNWVESGIRQSFQENSMCYQSEWAFKHQNCGLKLNQWIMAICTCPYLPNNAVYPTLPPQQ